MTWITRNLTLQIQKIVNFIVLEGENKGFYWYALILDDICAHWRFVDEDTARKSSAKIYQMYLGFKTQRDFIGMDMARKFLEMGFTRARRYANHSSGRKYDKMSGKIRPQEHDWRTNTKAKSAAIFKEVRDKAAYDPTYKEMRTLWRAQE